MQVINLVYLTFTSSHVTVIGIDTLQSECVDTLNSECVALSQFVKFVTFSHWYSTIHPPSQPPLPAINRSLTTLLPPKKKTPNVASPPKNPHLTKRSQPTKNPHLTKPTTHLPPKTHHLTKPTTHIALPSYPYYQAQEVTVPSLPTPFQPALVTKS